MDEFSSKTLDDLEWPRLLEALAARCSSEAARRLARALTPLEDRAGIAPALRQGREAWDALVRGEPLPLPGLREVEGAIERLKMGATLTPGALNDLAATLEAARTLRRYLHGRRDRMPALHAACAFDPSLDGVEDALREAFDRDGLLVDHASPRLRELRGAYREARERMIHKLEELMRRYQHILQDGFWTEREGRYVLPVRSDAQRFPGIVHTASASGATLFVEPRSLIPQGNRLKVLEAEVRREEEAIYTRLTGLLIEKLPSVIAAQQGLILADLRAAIGRLAVDARLSFLDVDPSPVVELREARHPLLALDGVQVVASDLSAEAGRAVILSGPNAGGKTVALKVVGLAALMLRAGLPLACAPGSRLGLFERILTDVGDEQSLARNLSTFSAHVSNLARILQQAGRGALVLLDEIATGTDPREGEALAAAVLDRLCELQAAVVCTTHYEGLKALALRDERFLNASAGVDPDTMLPRFRVVYGVPGSSVALSVARRYGVPEPVLAAAERFLSHESRDFEQTLLRLNDERRALDLARAAAERARQELERKQQELEVELNHQRSRGRAAVSREAEALLEAVRRARDDLRAVQARLRGNRRPDEGELKALEKKVNEVAARSALGGEFEEGARALAEQPPAPTEVRKGSRVYVPRLRLEAEVTEIQGEQLRVAAGPLKITVNLREVQPPRDQESKAARPAPRPLPEEPPRRTAENTCDLRGLRVDEAIRMAEQAVDRSVGAHPAVFLLHGSGSSALREAIRGVLANNASVARLRPGAPQEGGDGVTVLFVRLRAAAPRGARPAGSVSGQTRSCQPASRPRGPPRSCWR
ncbi:MAG: Smr/MutS family protein [Polyangiaceae bacterium]|jgi:DNA mismatch repair protein MutS2|nr:Smr/MutS family protein [Polyangiaceae bacterium]